MASNYGIPGFRICDRKNNAGGWRPKRMDASFLAMIMIMRLKTRKPSLNKNFSHLLRALKVISVAVTACIPSEQSSAVNDGPLRPSQ